MPGSTTFRFQLGASTLQRLRPFAATNADLNGKEFRAKWDGWCTINAAVVDAEAGRLRDLGYCGDVHGKLYRAARYYFKTRPPTLERAPRSRNSTAYIALAPQLLAAMDQHIVVRTRKHVHAKPAVLYTDFLASCSSDLVTLLASEITRIVDQGGVDTDAAASKIKKTYKNRYFRKTHTENASRR